MDPVCGEDGVVYSNKCLARCKGVTVECMGECPCPYSVTTPSSDPGLGYQDIANIFSYFEFTSDGKICLSCCITCNFICRVSNSLQLPRQVPSVWGGWKNLLQQV